jgi:hypothetical protein
MCEIPCPVVNTLAIYSEVHGYEYTLFAHRPPIMTRSPSLHSDVSDQTKEEKT